jgi:hypothetical protein
VGKVVGTNVTRRHDRAFETDVGGPHDPQRHFGAAPIAAK